MVKVEIWGPNLPKSKHDESFHVHTPECADTTRGIYQQARPPWQIDVEKFDDIVLDIYPPDEFDYDPNEDGEFSSYAMDVYVFPCVMFGR
jgi:hypothetical protein